MVNGRANVTADKLGDIAVAVSVLSLSEGLHGGNPENIRSLSGDTEVVSQLIIVI